MHQTPAGGRVTKQVRIGPNIKLLLVSPGGGEQGEQIHKTILTLGVSLRKEVRVFRGKKA